MAPPTTAQELIDFLNASWTHYHATGGTGVGVARGATPSAPTGGRSGPGDGAAHEAATGPWLWGSVWRRAVELRRAVRGVSSPCVSTLWGNLPAALRCARNAWDEGLVVTCVRRLSVAAESVKMLEAAGFQRLSELEEWKLELGGKYFLTRSGSTVVAFVLGGKFKPGNGFNVVAAHTDRCEATHDEDSRAGCGFVHVSRVNPAGQGMAFGS